MNAQDRPENAQGDHGSHLFDLPAEIRNIIYDSVLVRSKRIQIDKHNYQQPGLLRVNRQIRYEARPIYYRQNNFQIICPDFDGRAWQIFRKQTKEVVPPMYGLDNRRPAVSVSTEQGHPRNWTNLYRWVKVMHGERFGVILAHKGDPGRRVARAMMKVAVRLRHLPWTEAKYICAKLQGFGVM